MQPTSTVNRPPADLPERIGAALETAAAEALRELCNVAASEGLSLYLVGGAVRDHLLLDLASSALPGLADIDLAVEGDPTPLHAALARLGDASPTIHDRFGTASIHLAGGGRIDIARTRAEHYAAPGALPTVEPAPLLLDLKRRDFTVNAAAFALTGPDPGSLLDPYGAAADARRRIIRTLHAQSFVDDPTRLIRCARYAARLQARLSGKTASEVRRERHYLSVLTPGRFAEAWRLLLTESDPASALRQAMSMQLPQSRSTNWRVAPRVARVADSPERFWAGVGLSEPSREIVNRLPSVVALQRREQRALIDGARLRSFRRRIGGTRRASSVASILATTDPNALEVAIGLWNGAAERAVSEYRRRNNAVRSPIAASRLIELGVLPGPAIGAWLRWLTDAVWDRELDPNDPDAVARFEQRVASEPEFPPRRRLTQARRPAGRGG